MPAFVTASSAVNPALTSVDELALTIFPTTAGNDLLVEIALGHDPNAVPTVVSVTASGATFAQIPGAAVTRITGSRSARIETWRAPAVPANVTLVTAKTTATSPIGVLVGEYSSVMAIGKVVTASGAAVPVTVVVPTQDTNNMVVAGFAAEDFAGATFTGATTGSARALVYALGQGLPDVPGGLLDNTSASPASVTNTVTTTGQSLWVGAGVELRSTVGAGFRGFQSLWFGPEASTGIIPTAAMGSFRSFQSMWFGPDGDFGGVTPPTVVGGRKLINQALAATIQAELT